jgi:hypothetical protein
MLGGFNSVAVVIRPLLVVRGDTAGFDARFAM